MDQVGGALSNGKLCLSLEVGMVGKSHQLQQLDDVHGNKEKFSQGIRVMEDPVSIIIGP